MEWLDVVDENGVPTGEIVERTKAHRDGILHRTSHLWLLRHGKDGAEVLLQLRSLDKDSFPGCYDISSAGHIPAGCDFVESALRELFEELGIEAVSDELLFVGTRHIVYDKMFKGVPFIERQVSNVYAVWRDVDESLFRLQESEVSEVLWMNFEDCFNGVKNSLFPNCISLEELEMLRSIL